MSISDPISADPFEVMLDAEGLKAKSVHGSLVTIGSQTAKMAIQLCSQLVLARLLFPADFGLLAMVAPVIGFVQVINDIGLGQAIIQRKILTQNQVSSLFWMNLVASSALMAIVMATAPLVAMLYGEPKTTTLLIALGGLIPLSAMNVPSFALLSRKLRYFEISVIEVVSAVVTAAATVGAAYGGLSYWSLVVGQAVGVVVSLGLSWSACDWRPSRPSIDSGTWDDIKFGANLTGANLATFASTSGDNIIVGLMNGRVALGLYDRGYKLVLQPLMQLMAPFSRVAVPLLARLTDDASEYRNAYLRIVRTMMLVSIPGLIVCIGNGRSIVLLLLGSRWEEAAPIFSWICVGGLTSALYSSASWLFVSQGRSRDLLIFSTAAAVINVVSFLIGASISIVGVAAVSAVSFTCIQTPLILYGATKSGPVDTRVVAKCVLPLALAGVLAFVGQHVGLATLQLPTFLELAAKTLLSYLIFCLALLALPGGKSYLADVARVQRMLKRKP